MNRFRVLFIGMMSVGLFSLVIGLAGCASDGYSENEDYDGHHKGWRERAFSRHTGSGSGFAADEILSGGVVQ